MALPRVYLICANQLVCEAVNVLLRREGVTLLGMETDTEVALAQVSELKPDVVLGAGGDEAAESSLTRTLARLVSEKGPLRVIRLGLADKELYIYHQEHRRLVDVRDLLAAISTGDVAA
ncbi:MAG: hypothetical protein M1570_00830 [Chloroflexi bacterium]|nr:hypothetical protein [Chloroflexota bacterium]